LLSLILFQVAANASLQDFIDRNASYQGFDNDPTKGGTQLAENSQGGGVWGTFKTPNGKYFYNNNGYFYAPKDLYPDAHDIDLTPNTGTPANSTRPPLHIVNMQKNRRMAKEVFIVRATKDVTHKWVKTCGSVCRWHSVSVKTPNYPKNSSAWCYLYNGDGHLNGYGCTNLNVNQGRPLGSFGSDR